MRTRIAERLGCEASIFAFALPRRGRGGDEGWWVRRPGRRDVAGARRQGAWCGTIWLGTREGELTPFEKHVLSDLCSIPADQVVRTIAAETSVRDTMCQLQSEYIATMERLATMAAP